MLSNKVMPCGGGAAAADSGLTLAVPGTYSVVIPTGITSVAGFAIGGGGGGGGTSSAATSSAGGGGGGGLSYSNAISVTPGETLTIVVGGGGSRGGTAGTSGTAGGDSRIHRSGTNLILAKGGGLGGGNTGSSTGGGGAGGAAASGVGDTKYSGGAGGTRAANDYGGGGGGAGGYSGNGGAGGFSTTNPTAGSGGAGGGGYYGYTGSAIATTGGDGGGTLFYGSGSNGAAGTASSTLSVRSGGFGSTLGTTTKRIAPGGGGGGASSNGLGQLGRVGADGVVRMLWGGTKSFPSTGLTNSISLYTSVSSSSSTITVPSDVQVGDLLVLGDFVTGAVAPEVIPSGFTKINGSSSASGRIVASYSQVLDASVAGTVLTGMDGTADYKILLVLRGTNGYTYFGDNSSYSDVTGTTPTAETLGSNPVDSYAEGISASIAFFYGSNGITPATDLTFTGATFIQGTSNVFYVGYKLYTQADTNVETTNVGMVDRGTNALSMFQLRGY